MYRRPRKPAIYFIRNIYDKTISSFFADNKMKYLFLFAVLLPMILGAPQERFISKLGFLFKCLSLYFYIIYLGYHGYKNMQEKYMNISRKPVHTKHMRNSAKNKPLHVTLKENKTNKKNKPK